MKNGITTMNKNSAEQRRTNDAETVEKAMEHKMLKPLTGALKDEKTVLGALEQIVSRCCDGVQSYDREITGCVKKIRKYGPGQYFLLARENAMTFRRMALPGTSCVWITHIAWRC